MIRLTPIATLAILSAFLALPSTGCQTSTSSTPGAVTSAPTPTPPPTPPQAVSSFDASAAPAACIDACNRMVLVGCVELATCPTTLAAVEAHRLNPNPANGNLPLTCADLAGEPPSKLPPLASQGDVTARGWSCGP